MEVTLDDLEPVDTGASGAQEMGAARTVTMDDLEAVDAPSNSVYHEPSKRVLDVPQTLDPVETQYLIDRDIDQKKDFFAMQPRTPEEAMGQIYESVYRRLGAFVGGVPGDVAGLGIEQSDIAKERLKSGKTQESMAAGIFGAPKLIRDLIFSNPDVADGLAKVKARNERWLQSAGFKAEPGNSAAKFVYDATGALSQAGAAVMLRAPKLVVLAQSAFTKSDAYDEAKAKGLSTNDASDYSNQQFAWNLSTEAIGTAYLFKSLAEDTVKAAVKKAALSESTQEFGQNVGQDVISNEWDVTDKNTKQILNDAAYNAILGGLTGGTIGGVGTAFRIEAENRGINTQLAAMLQKHFEEELNSMPTLMADYLEREVKPIADQDHDAKTFLQIMDKLGNDPKNIDESQFSESDLAIYDQFLKMFNESANNTQGVAAVEKKFLDQALSAGLSQESAVAGGRLLGARSEAAARALGITPMEWYKSWNLDIEVQRTKEEAIKAYADKLDLINTGDIPPIQPKVEEPLTPEEEAAKAQEIEGIQNRLNNAKGATRDVSTKKPIISYLKKLGGIRTDGLIYGELKHLGIDRKTAVGLFKNNDTAMRDIDNIPVEEFNRALGVAAKDDGNGYVDRDWLLEALRNEQFGERMGQERPVEDDSFIQALDKAGLDYRTATAEQVYEALGADADIVSAAADMGVELSPREVRQIRGLMDTDPSMDVQDAIDSFVERQAITRYQKTDKTAAGDQFVLPGAEKISDKQLAERKMEGGLKAKKPQQAMDIGLFGDEAKQQTLFQRVVYNERITEMTKEVLTDMAQKSASISDPKDFVARAEMGALTPSERARLPKDIVRTADELRDRVKDTLYQLDQAGLVVQHNIKLRGLLNAHKLGGLPVPSLAIVKSGSPIGGFGEITLIGDKKLIDPAQSKKNKVFAADAYSPRYPSVRYAYNYKALQALEKALEPYAQKITQEKNDWWAVLPQPDRVEERGSEAFEESGAIAAKYLDAKGIPLPEPEKYGDKISASATARRVVAAAREVNGYSEYAKAVADSIITGEKIFDGFTPSGNRRYLDHNLDNVVKILTRKVRDGEGFNYGVGSIRAVYTKQFKSLKNLVDHADRIVSSEDFVAIKDKVDKEFIALSDEWREHSPLKNEFGFLDAFSEHLKEGASKGLGYVNREYYEGAVPEEVLNKTAAFLNSLKNMPTEYFEAKIQRAVQLQEFEAAVVPEGAQYEEAVALLKKRGLEVERYKAGDEVSRRQAIGKFQRLFFQEGARGAITFSKNRTLIQLFQDANPSTLLHELGHLFLRDMVRVAKQSRRPMVAKDLEVIKKWLGTDSTKFTEQQEEKFARGFEAYLREGKAPKPELQTIFDKFKEWLTSIYKSIRDLDVTINDDVRQAFDRMLGADYAKTEKDLKERDAAKLERDYQIVEQQDTSDILGDAGSVLAGGKQLAANMFSPVASRLGRIDPTLKAVLRKYNFEMGLHENQDRKRALPFLEAMEKMTEADYRRLDFAMKNRDDVVVSELAKKYGAEKEFAEIRSMLDDIYNEAISVGLDVEYLENYFPRMVRLDKADQYMAALRGRADWSLIEEALKEADPMNAFTNEEKAVFVNKWLRGHAPNATLIALPSFVKERVVDYVEPQWNQYYLESGEALLKYISAMRLGIAQKKIFGKGGNVEESIGAYVLKLVETGAIRAEQEQEVKMLFSAALNSKGTGVFVSWLKNAGYIYLMGSPISAITQIGDLAFALAKNGYYRTGVSLVKAVAGKSMLTKEDIGIANIAQEFEDNSRAGHAVRKVFKVVGLEWMDNIGKQVYIESAYKRLVAEAKANKPALKKSLEQIFGEEATQVRKDLVSGAMNDNIKMLLFSELSDVQPVSLAEMPVGYLKGGNWRALYMLKTYTVKQIDTYRREVFDKMATGEPAQIREGTAMMIRLATALMLTGMGADSLKDLLLGRAITLSELVMDNMLKMAGLTKFQIYQSRQDGVANTIMQMFFVPPLYAPFDNVIKDIQRINSGKLEAKDALTFSYVPVIGKFYYWWVGGGRTKEEKKKKQ